MKMRAIIGFLFLICVPVVLANGIGVIDARNAVCLRLDSSDVRVNVEGQISTTITTQYFTNATLAAPVKYGFPLPEGASATALRYFVNGQWYQTVVGSMPPDTSLPGGSTHQNIRNYLGASPIYFQIPQTVSRTGVLFVELTYVELLPYLNGSVTFSYPGNYTLIQTTAIAKQSLNFQLRSQRAIDTLIFNSTHPLQTYSLQRDSAEILSVLSNAVANRNYSIIYRLSMSDLGLFAYSTYQDSIPDTLGRGFLTFIAEPAMDSSLATIRKVFTLIVDRSGSMSGTKMTQAKDAATYIVNNLNEGDRFNIIDFDDQITSFRPRHAYYTTAARDSARAYINALYARGSTNISGVFDVAIPQFNTANDSTANIVIFMTDGVPTAGITEQTQLVRRVDSLFTAAETNISLFNFGIGTDVNQQLLSLMANHNRGFTTFLLNENLMTTVTSFYNTIRNPVLINPTITFNPSVVTECYPTALPSVYRGSQLIVAGRYQEASTVRITLRGTAFSRPVSYDYWVNLADTANARNQFLTKVWAKKIIETLMLQYYTFPTNSAQAIALRQRVISISLAYGVVSPFTSFSGGGTGVEEQPAQPANTEAALPAFELMGNYPNPFNSSTAIRLNLNIDHHGVLEVRIYNVLGQLVRTLKLKVDGKGAYTLAWDGKTDGGTALTAGVYFYAIDLHNTILTGKMQYIK